MQAQAQTNRMDRLTWDSTRVAVFDFTAGGRTDARAYWKGTGANDTVATTAYTHDAFGRLTEIDSTDSGDASIVDFARGYDYAGNPKHTEYEHKTTRSEIYGTQTGAGPEGPSDDLGRLTRFRHGTLNDTKDDLTVSLYEQDWHDAEGDLTLDKLGNWDAVRIDKDGDDTSSSMATTSRGHNTANEYTSLGGGSAYAHDRNGNLTDDEEFTFYYDFANHLVRAVKQDTGDTVGEYHYDALGRRVRKVMDDVSDTLDGATLFYYSGMRVIEEGRLDEGDDYVASHQYVWGLYLDELMVYDFDEDGDGDFDSIGTDDTRLYRLNDFIYSSAAVIEPDGDVLERYDYTPYGEVTVWKPDYADTRSEAHVHLAVLFTGQRYDPETGLHHYKSRALRPELGRFLQRDSLDLIERFDPYQYASSAAHHLGDSLGFQAQSTTTAPAPKITPLSDKAVNAQNLCKKVLLPSVEQWIKNKPHYRLFYAVGVKGRVVKDLEHVRDSLMCEYDPGDPGKCVSWTGTHIALNSAWYAANRESLAEVWVHLLHELVHVADSRRVFDRHDRCRDRMIREARAYWRSGEEPTCEKACNHAWLSADTECYRAYEAREQAKYNEQMTLWGKRGRPEGEKPEQHILPFSEWASGERALTWIDDCTKFCGKTCLADRFTPDADAKRTLGLKPDAKEGW